VSLSISVALEAWGIVLEKLEKKFSFVVIKLSLFRLQLDQPNPLDAKLRPLRQWLWATICRLPCPDSAIELDQSIVAFAQVKLGFYKSAPFSAHFQA
jgi:hypothetical protein